MACWIGLCIASVFVILPRTKNLSGLKTVWSLFPGWSFPTLHSSQKGGFSGCFKDEISPTAEAGVKPSLIWSWAPFLPCHPQLCEGHQLSGQKKRLNDLLSKPCPSSKAQFKCYVIRDICYPVPPTRMPTFWSRTSVFILQQQLLPICGSWLLLSPRVILGKPVIPWHLSLFLCKVGLTTMPVSHGAYGKREKYCLNWSTRLQAPCGQELYFTNSTMAKTLFLESSDHWAFVGLGVGIRWGKDSEALLSGW